MSIIGGSGIIPSGGGIAPAAGGGAGADIGISVAAGPFDFTVLQSGLPITVINPSLTLPGAVKVVREGPLDVIEKIAFSQNTVIQGSGTISWTGTTVTGTGTAFTSECAVWDMIGTPPLYLSADMAGITGIVSDTELTVDAPPINDPILAGTAYEIDTMVVLQDELGTNVSKTYSVYATGNLPTTGGLVTWSGTTITGVSTEFIRQAKAGGTITVDPQGVNLGTDIVSVDSPTQLTVAATQTVGSGAIYDLESSVDIVTTFSDGEINRSIINCVMLGPFSLSNYVQGLANPPTIECKFDTLNNTGSLGGTFQVGANVTGSAVADSADIPGLDGYIIPMAAQAWAATTDNIELAGVPHNNYLRNQDRTIIMAFTPLTGSLQAGQYSLLEGDWGATSSLEVANNFRYESGTGFAQGHRGVALDGNGIWTPIGIPGTSTTTVTPVLDFGVYLVAIIYNNSIDPATGYGTLTVRWKHSIDGSATGHSYNSISNSSSGTQSSAGSSDMSIIGSNANYTFHPAKYRYFAIIDQTITEAEFDDMANIII